jgi:uncharacterized protein (TIGR02757 family)
MDRKGLRAFLDRKVKEYNRPAFIASDPISIPHAFRTTPDIEIAAFFAAIFAWGNRTTIIRKSRELMRMMDDAPHQFVMQHSERDLKKMMGFRHRTFNATDLYYFIEFLKQHYGKYETLEDAFLMRDEESSRSPELGGFYRYFFSLEDAPRRTHKHIASPEKNSSCKRLNMFLRWMVRKDDMGVDFGLWKRISPALLICPLDVHVARVARHFGLLMRRQTDWTAALELTERLRELDRNDPVKYDFALFGLGAVEKF